MDVGCGYGESYNYCNLNDIEWYGLELDKRKAKKLSEAGRNVIEATLETCHQKYNAYFDYILASQLLEHFPDPHVFFSNCYELLKPGGKMILSTPNHSSRFRKRYHLNWINYHTPYHQILYTQKALRALVEKHNFRVCKYIELTPIEWYLYQRRYKRPDKGEKSQWYNEPFKKSKILLYSPICFLSDFLYGNSDCVFLIAQKL